MYIPYLSSRPHILYPIPSIISQYLSISSYRHHRSSPPPFLSQIRTNSLNDIRSLSLNTYHQNRTQSNISSSLPLSFIYFPSIYPNHGKILQSRQHRGRAAKFQDKNGTWQYQRAGHCIFHGDEGEYHGVLDSDPCSRQEDVADSDSVVEGQHKDVEVSREPELRLEEDDDDDGESSQEDDSQGEEDQGKDATQDLTGKDATQDLTGKDATQNFAGGILPITKCAVNRLRTNIIFSLT